jgi:hypothetical protein
MLPAARRPLAAQSNPSCCLGHPHSRTAIVVKIALWLCLVHSCPLSPQSRPVSEPAHRAPRACDLDHVKASHGAQGCGVWHHLSPVRKRLPRTRQLAQHLLRQQVGRVTQPCGQSGRRGMAGGKLRNYGLVGGSDKGCQALAAHMLRLACPVTKVGKIVLAELVGRSYVTSKCAKRSYSGFLLMPALHTIQ